MRSVRSGFWLFCAVVVAIEAGFESAAQQAPTDDEQMLRSVGLVTDTPALLEFFRKRTVSTGDRDKVKALIRQLGESSVEMRHQAAADLIAHGSVAVPYLRHAINDLDDPEVASRAQRCLQAIEGASGAALPAAAARLLAARQPPEAVEALLAYLPFADDAGVVDQVAAALTTLAFPAGKPHPVLMHGLQDPVALRRAVAAEVLCRPEHPETWPMVRRLLRDPKPTVRLRSALALASLPDPDAVPVLIELVAELPPPQRQKAEEFLEQLAAEWAPRLAPDQNDEVTRRIRRDAWAAWWKNTEGPLLLEEFRKRTLSDSDREKIAGLVKYLGDPLFVVREQAVADLAAQGSKALPLLRQALGNPDPEVVRRAGECLKIIEKGPPDHLPPVAARLVALRKPAGAAEVLLAYLPFAPDEGMGGVVREALAAVAFRDDKADPALMKALEDPVALRRAAAAEALCRSGGPEQRQAVRKLLQDRDPTVRLQVAITLATAQHRDAVPVLIELLGELPPEQAGPAYEFLCRLAGEKAPEASPGADEAGRTKCRDAWAAWWKENATVVDLVQLSVAQRLLGYTLLVLVDDNGAGKVVELGTNGKPRWTIDGLQYPVDAYMLSNGRVLVAEYNGRKVTERDTTGKVIWEKTGLNSQVVNAQRLTSGNTFIATSRGVVEVDRAGRDVFTYTSPRGLIAAAKSPSGQAILLESGGNCVRLDAAGKEVKRFASNRGDSWTSGIDIAPNGRILIAQTDRSKVAEFDLEGKMIWEATATGVTTATRLVNGNTLLASHEARRAWEIDSKGKTIWDYKDTMHIFRARKR